MRGLFRSLGCLPIVLFPICAQEAPAPLPPAMQSAIDRIITVDPRASATPVVLNGAIPLPKACSVPLLEMRMDHPEQFAIRTAPPPKTVDAMPLAQPPAPACERRP